MFHLPFTYTTLQSLPRHNNLVYLSALWTNASVIWPVVVANSTEQHKPLEYCLQWVAFEEGSSLPWIPTLAMVRVDFTAFFESCFPV